MTNRTGALAVGRAWDARPDADPAVGGANLRVDVDWVVEDQEMVRLHEMAAAIAKGSISVLIVGETGSGKEILAETIHRQSPRSGGPFVCLNCAALPEALLESELFGHERGAFTGAVQTKQGLLEAAEGGTVFLDEIGEMPLTVQAKLLRVMEDKAVRPVGGRQHRPIRARFVFATNRKLNEEMSRGAFRADLYHRLSGAVLSVPPLRNRPREIEPLARLFLTRAAREAGQNWPPRLAPETLECLSTHTWPGNIRELRNVMERAMLVCGGDEVRLEHLPGELTAREAVALDQPPAVPDALGREDLLRVVGGREPLGLGSRSNAIADDERQRIMRALELCAGNQTRAARLLEISRATLIRRLAAYGFARPRSPEQVCALPGRSD